MGREGGGSARRKPIGLTIVVDRGLWDKAGIRRSTTCTSTNTIFAAAGEVREERETRGGRRKEVGTVLEYLCKHVPVLGRASGPCAV